MGFDFLKDKEGAKVFTGHNDGLITINVAEADDPFREKIRVQLGESYRTVLGHFRHEIGHYYWDRLIRDSADLPAFRDMFGDEQASYDEARAASLPGRTTARLGDRLRQRLRLDAPLGGLGRDLGPRTCTWSTRCRRRAPTACRLGPRRDPADVSDFDDLLGGWVPLTLAMNSLNRSMGLADAYPFILSEAAIAKLRFVHQIVRRSGRAQAQPQPVARP